MGARERNESKRRIWHRIVSHLDPTRLVFLDESGATISLHRHYGRAPKGERSSGRAPRNYGENLTLIASLSVAGLETAMLLDGATDRAAFQVYMEQILAPTLVPGQIVVMDNLNVHKHAPIRQVIEAAGCHVLFLPSYSPDFNPIELAFSEIKAYIRRVGARTREALEAAITTAIDRVTAAHALAYFAHCGYDSLAL